LHGPRGIGKLGFAKALAQALLCEAPRQSGAACGACLACGWFGAGNHPDFRRVEPETEDDAAPGEEREPQKRASRQITVDQVRQLEELVEKSTHRGGAKVILIHPAEALNIHAANALLKSLEEPPAGTIFLLVAHRPAYLPATVRSRCRQVPLARPRHEAALTWLAAEGVPEPALALADAGGAPLLARVLDEADYWPRRKAFLTSLADSGFEPLAAAERATESSVEEVVGWLQKWTFDALLQRAAGCVRFNPDFAGPIDAIARAADPVALLRYHRGLIRLQRVVHHPLNTRLLFEALLVDYRHSIAPAAPSVPRAA
jgi:DNA polymerase-3 subunit delta'